MKEEILLEFNPFENTGVRIVLKIADITEQRVDAVVNAANSRLQHGGGVAWAIVEKGGWSIQEESDRIGHVETGKSALTNAGKLPAKKVIHTVGPRWGEGDEVNKLFSAVFSSLKLADENGLRSIAFPAVSAGIFGFPRDRCAEVMLSALKGYLKEKKDTKLRTVMFCLFDRATGEIFKERFLKGKEL